MSGLKNYFYLVLTLIFAVSVSIFPIGHIAEACTSSDGEAPPWGGSVPNGFMAMEIERAWAATGSPTKSPPLPPITGSHPTIIVLIENTAAGVTFLDGSVATWKNRLDEIAAYYNEVSNGNLSIVPATESHGIANDGIIGPVDVSLLVPTSDVRVVDNSRPFAVEAIQKINPFIDFASLDTDNSGTLEADELHILIYQAGDETSFSANSLPRAWAHMIWQEPRITGLVPTLDSDNINISSYAYCGAEFNGIEVATMGQMTHELGHDLGLADLYDVDGTGSGGDWNGIGKFGLMASGSWGWEPPFQSGSSPTHINGFFKDRLGWANTTVMTAPSEGLITLNAASGSNDVLKIVPPGGNEIFIIENRQQIGFDNGIPGSFGGLAIFHGDLDILTDANIRLSNNVNKSPTNFGIALMQADGLDQLGQKVNRGSNLDLFRTETNVLFNTSTNPNSKLKTGASSGVRISQIGDSLSSMTFFARTSPATAFTGLSGGGAFEEGSSSVLNATYVNTDGAVSFQWYKDNVPLSDSPPNVTGTATDTLTINSLQLSGDSGQYHVELTDNNGTIASNAVPVTVFAVGSLPAMRLYGIILLLGVFSAWGVRRIAH